MSNETHKRICLNVSKKAITNAKEQRRRTGVSVSKTDIVTGKSKRLPKRVWKSQLTFGPKRSEHSGGTENERTFTNLFLAPRLA